MNEFFVPPSLNIFHTKEQGRIWGKFWRNVNRGKYNCLTDEESEVLRGLHEERLRSRFQQFALDGTLGLPIKLQDGTEFLSGYNRIVIGDHGPYIEFEKKDLLLDIREKPGQEWRRDERYECKYLWKQPVTQDEDGEVVGRNVKIYHQIKKVKYADYLTNMMYVDPYEVMDSTGYVDNDIF